LLTPSPSRATRPVTAILGGVERLVREAVSDKGHFAIIGLIKRGITL